MPALTRPTDEATGSPITPLQCRNARDRSGRFDRAAGDRLNLNLPVASEAFLFPFHT